jgi:glutamate synthase (NADPH/NADH) small chain
LGLPIGNKQPEFQAALAEGKWREAYNILSETNDFPEFTGRICPASCEKACVLQLSADAPTTIRENEVAIAELPSARATYVPSSRSATVSAWPS